MEITVSAIGAHKSKREGKDLQGQGRHDNGQHLLSPHCSPGPCINSLTSQRQLLLPSLFTIKKLKQRDFNDLV